MCSGPRPFFNETMSAVTVAPSVRASPNPRRKGVALAATGIACAAWLAFHNTFSVPFFFDDITAINANASIRDLGSLAEVLAPPAGGTGVAGRPLVNLSLAINFACGGLEVYGYHVLNLVLHTAAGLALFGLVRRTLLQPSLGGRFESRATILAALVAVLWTVHPLQTESVTCVVQRTEVLVGLWYLFTLYCFVRGIDENSTIFWHSLAVASCFLGMASKEVMVSAPLMVLLYDRTFCSRTFRLAWYRHWKTYVGLAATWLLLAFLVWGGRGSRGTAAGFGLGVTWWSYALKQCEAILLYLRLAFWPHPLVLDYGTGVVTDPVEVWPQALLLILLVVGVLFALYRRPVCGFIGMWFFAILAPSSSILPLVSQTVAEHRMYLPLAAVVVLVVVGGFVLVGRLAVIAAVVVAIAFTGMTVSRNEDYSSAVSIWTDTLSKAKGSNRARVNLANALKESGRNREAIELYRSALAEEPPSAEVLCNLGSALSLSGSHREAVGFLERAVQLRPDLAEAHANLGAVRGALGKPWEALTSLRVALALNPLMESARVNLAGVLVRVGSYAEAMEHCQLALRENAKCADAYFFWGDALLHLGRPQEAIPRYQSTLQLRPDFAEAHNNLATAYYQLNRTADAALHYRAALRIKPELADAQNNLASALLRLGDLPAAIGHYREALRLNPNYVDAWANLAMALVQAGQIPEAIAANEAALRLNPEHKNARTNMDYLRKEIAPIRAQVP